MVSHEPQFQWRQIVALCIPLGNLFEMVVNRENWDRTTHRCPKVLLLTACRFGDDVIWESDDAFGIVRPVDEFTARESVVLTRQMIILGPKCTGSCEWCAASIALSETYCCRLLPIEGPFQFVICWLSCYLFIAQARVLYSMLRLLYFILHAHTWQSVRYFSGSSMPLQARMILYPHDHLLPALPLWFPRIVMF